MELVTSTVVAPYLVFGRICNASTGATGFFSRGQSLYLQLSVAFALVSHHQTRWNLIGRAVKLVQMQHQIKPHAPHTGYLL